MPSRPSSRPGGPISTMGAGKNAHIREETKPDNRDVMAEQATRLKDDPAFKTAVSDVKSECMRQIEGLIQDGSPETEELERELCRTIRTLKGVERAVIKRSQNQELRDHNFRPHVVDEGEPANV